MSPSVLEDGLVMQAGTIVNGRQLIGEQHLDEIGRLGRGENRLRSAHQMKEIDYSEQIL